MSTGGADEGGLYPPREAARLLDVSPSGLRRLAAIYSDLYGELPRDKSEQGEHKTRLWPAEALERLRAARALVDAKRWPSIKDALEALERGEEAPEPAPLATPPAAELVSRIEALATLPGQVDALAERQAEALELLRHLADTVTKQSAAIERLEAKLERAEARQHDEQPVKRRAWWRWWG